MVDSASCILLDPENGIHQSLVEGCTMITPEVWKDSCGLGHCSLPISDRDTEIREAARLISQLNILTECPIVFERVTNHGTVIYGHALL